MNVEILLQVVFGYDLTVYKINTCVQYRSAFQAGHVGSIPIARCLTLSDSACQEAPN